MRLHYNDIHLCADCFYVNQIAFNHTISKDIKFRTVQPIRGTPNRAISIQSTKEVIQVYQRRGFHVNDFYDDKEFECIRNEILPTCTHIAAAGTKVPEIERSVRTVLIMKVSKMPVLCQMYRKDLRLSLTDM